MLMLSVYFYATQDAIKAVKKLEMLLALVCAQSMQWKTNKKQMI